LYWLACNLLNNAFPGLQVDQKLKARRFRLSERRLDEFWNDIAEGASPSRRLCDLFWLSLPWGPFLSRLGRINALEVGCGSGTYGRLLERILGADLERYLGVDIAAHDQWTSGGSPRLSFKVGEASDVHEFMRDVNLVFTQSALEHFEEDLLFFSRISGLVKAIKSPILQIHLIPSASCLTTFPWHGVREYTPRTISKVTRLFGSETDAYLFSLGGPSCNRTHRKYITWPHLRSGSDLRRTRMQDYLASVRSAIVSDFSSEATGAAFYALVLFSNVDLDPFAGI
jgi:hypothetical protein